MKHILTKYTDWSYEKEWRIVQIDQTCEDKRKDIPFERPIEVYMGLSKKVEDKLEEIMKCALISKKMMIL